MSEKTPLLVSVCLITYNHAKYIKEAIEGVLMQETTFSWNLVIADDFSKDGTREIIKGYKKSFPDRIELILQKENVGAGKNWLDLITFPTSKYIAYFEGDDYWTDPQKLQKQVDFLESVEGSSFSFHRVKTIKSSEKDTFEYPIPTKNLMSFYDLAKDHYIATGSIMFRREYLKDCLPKWFDEIFVQDIPFELLLASKGKVGYIDEEMGVYRRNLSSLTHSKAQNDKLRSGYIKMYKLLASELPIKYSLAIYKKVWKYRLGYIKDIFR